MLAATPNAVGLARLHTADVLSRWGVPSDVVETVQLIVSELTTNAVQHPAEGGEQDSLFSPRNTPETFELLLEMAYDAVRVSVWDRDQRPPVLKQVGVEATDGRGIFLVAVMSRTWGHYPARAVAGKVVWAEVGLVPASRLSEDEKFERSPGRPPSTWRSVPPAERLNPNLPTAPEPGMDSRVRTTGHRRQPAPIAQGRSLAVLTGAAVSAVGASDALNALAHLAVTEVEASAWALPALSVPDLWEPGVDNLDAGCWISDDTASADMPLATWKGK
ncbi:ATP-binding protein [Streptomyces sp. NPDC048255]|uniref:ATP-binding protein n=1 Tax=Streptomyces sp. NPDC048255 TaxID=3154713 RepID=UPI0033F6CB59